MSDTTEARTPFLIRIVFLAAVAFTLIGVIEAAFIGYDMFTGGSLSRFRAPDLERGIRSWTMHHAMRPGFSDSAARLNSFGLRTPEVVVPKPADTFRILLLGDSFTFGFRVGEAAPFARQLEAQLNQASAVPVEVVNAGVVSYCPLLEYLQYRHQLHVLEPDLVILNFDMSDVQDHLLYSRNLVRASDGTPLYVTEPSLGRRAGALPSLLSWEWVGLKIDAVRRRFQAANEASPFVRDLDRYIWTLDDGPDMEKEALATMEPIADLQKLLAHHGIPLLVATYPQPWQVSAAATPGGGIRSQYGVGPSSVHRNDRPFRLLSRFAAERSLAFVNATDAFRADPEPASLFQQSDFHFTAKGHQVYATVLANELAGRALVSALPR